MKHLGLGVSRQRSPARFPPDGAKQSPISAEIASSLTPLLAMTPARWNCRLHKDFALGAGNRRLGGRAGACYDDAQSAFKCRISLRE